VKYGKVVPAVMVLCVVFSSKALALDQSVPGSLRLNDAAPDAEEFVAHGGLRRRYLVHVPEGFDGAHAVPVIIGFHGDGSRASEFRQQSQLNSAADEYGFIAVYAEGTGTPQAFNAGDCCGDAVRNHVDDVGFVRDLIYTLRKKYPADSDRIYATGIDNGAGMAYRLGCELSDRIAAIAPVAGIMSVEGPEPPRPVPIIQFQNGSIPETLAFWLRVNHCQPEPVKVETNNDYTMERYAPSPGQTGAPVVLHKLSGGSRAWPPGANRILWKFLSQASLNSLYPEEEAK
jgi:polyhydroxybutyrate depolymerase